MEDKIDAGACKSGFDSDKSTVTHISTPRKKWKLSDGPVGHNIILVIMYVVVC